MKPDERTARRTGRPIDRSADARILALTLQALAQQEYDRVTVDSIAAASGRAKTTLYRRWPTKTALVLAAVHSVGRPPEAEVLPDTGTLRGDLLAIIDSPWLGGVDHRLAVLTGLASAARTSTELADAVRDGITEPYVAAHRDLLQRAVDRGLLPPGVRARIPLLAQVVPAMSSRRIGLTDPPVGRAYYVAVVDEILLPALGQDR